MAIDPGTLVRSVRDAIRIEDTPALIEAWRQAHFAAQAVAELGKSWGQPQDDDSHSNLRWDARGEGLSSALVDGETPCRAVLLIAGLEIEMVGADESVLETFALEGRTLAESVGWVRARAERCTGSAERQPSRPAPDLPAHGLAGGASFETAKSPGLLSLSRLYGMADGLFDAAGKALPDPSSVRTWPHHFDIAVLSTLARDEAGAMSRTVGLGLTPPDSVDPHGYWYVSAWPTPPPADRIAAESPLPIGRWETDGRLMGVLGLEGLEQLESGTAQLEAVGAFIASACNTMTSAAGAADASERIDD